MGKPKQYIESLKNIMLVVLFITTMLLLYFFWGNPISNSFRITDIIGEEPSEIPSIEAVTRPDNIVVHVGGGSYTVLDETEFNAWDRCLQLLRGLKRENVVTFEEITGEQYKRIMEFRSIVYHFNYPMPMEAFLKKYKVQDLPGDDQIGEFSLVGYSSGSPESLFLWSHSKNKYYRMVYREPHTMMEELLSSVEKVAEANYYSIGDLVGTDNSTVVPLTLTAHLDEVPYSPEFMDLNTEEVKEFAQTFFGESFDFVRKIEESKGSHIYMYGYGEKVLTIDADGRVEYKNKETPQGNQQSYFEALDSAMQFVAAHGGWQTKEGTLLSPYVLFAQTIESNKQKGYRFVFGMKLSEGALYSEGSQTIMVEVIHGKVTQYLRDMIWIAEENSPDQWEEPEREAFTVINVVAQNYAYIASILAEEGQAFGDLTGEALFDQVSQLIQSVKTGYVKPKNPEQEENLLIPAWVIQVEDLLIYFGLYDARPLGYTVLMGP